MLTGYLLKINSLLFSLMLSLGLASCRSAVENPVIDAFGWEILTADASPDSSKYMGLTDLTHFLEAIDGFPWKAQTRLADQLQKVSPTLSLTDLKTDRTLFISSISTDRPDELSYYVGYLLPISESTWFGTRIYRRAETYEICSINEIRPIVSLFFSRSNQLLPRLKNYPSVLPAAPERIKWKEYVKNKEKYLKASPNQ